MHVRSLDHCFLVNSISVSHPTFVRLKVTHLNLGYEGKPFMMPGPKEYKINQSQYPFYVLLTKKDCESVRKTSGLPRSAKLRWERLMNKFNKGVHDEKR